MKKLLAIVAIAAFMTACNDEKKTETTVTSTDTSAKMMADTATKMMSDTATKMVDTAASKMMADTSKMKK